MYLSVCRHCRRIIIREIHVLILGNSIVYFGIVKEYIRDTNDVVDGILIDFKLLHPVSVYLLHLTTEIQVLPHSLLQLRFVRDLHQVQRFMLYRVIFHTGHQSLIIRRDSLVSYTRLRILLDLSYLIHQDVVLLSHNQHKIWMEVVTVHRL